MFPNQETKSPESIDIQKSKYKEEKAKKQGRTEPR